MERGVRLGSNRSEGKGEIPGALVPQGGQKELQPPRMEKRFRPSSDSPATSGKVWSPLATYMPSFSVPVCTGNSDLLLLSFIGPADCDHIFTLLVLADGLIYTTPYGGMYPV